MITKELKEGLFALSYAEKDLRIFMGDSYTDAGLVFNSYLCVGETEAAVFGAPNAANMALWSEEISRLCGGRELCYVSCCQSADAMAVAALREKHTELRVIGSAAALHVLGEKGLCIRGKRTVSLGGKTWALSDGAGGNVFACCEELNVLLSGRAYGSYCASEDSGDWLRGAKNYRRDNPYPWTLPEGVKLICPVYGPVVDGIGELAALYSENSIERSDVLIMTDGSFFASQLSECIAEGVSDSGVIIVQRISLCDVSRDEVLERVKSASALLFGFTGRTHKSMLDILTSLKKKECMGKSVLTFACTDNSEWQNQMKALFEPLGFDLSASDFVCVGKPDEAMLKAAYEKGFDFGCSLQRIANPRAPKLVKCLVCGEVFDASLGICPVCGVGLDQCIPAEEDAVTYANDTDRDYLIIGGGIAAVSAAEAIRKRDKTGAIDVISAEETLPINRPMLTKDMQTAIYRPEEMLVHGAEWYEERDIRFHLAQRVTDIDTKNKHISLQNGEKMSYDRLVYALGGECFVPPIKGVEKRGVFTIRRLADVHALAADIKTAKNAVVIGGGVLGLEAAGELHRLGLRVTVIEGAEQICSRQIDRKTADSFVSVMERMGVPCHTGVAVDEICGGVRADSVKLIDGRAFPADVVVVSCGIAANYALAERAGLECDRAVLVNERMETSEKDIYACGDCAVYEGVNCQLWAEATEQGKVAGANATGDSLYYHNKPLGFSLAAFGAEVYAIGDVGNGERRLRTVEMTDSVRNKGESWFFHGGTLEGAIVFNKPDKVDKVTAAVRERARYDELFD